LASPSGEDIWDLPFFVVSVQKRRHGDDARSQHDPLCVTALRAAIHELAALFGTLCYAW
jgi:hypothetical protein